MDDYEKVRIKFKPSRIRILLIAESPPPSANVESSRQFYRNDRIRKNDRLFVNTIKALYSEVANLTEKELELQKDFWLSRLQNDGYYMIEALDESQKHEVTKRQRQEKIKKNLPNLLKKASALATEDTKIILIKSNVFEVAAKPLKEAGFNVLNKELVDYPGQFNQRAYREKLKKLLKIQ